MLHHAPSDPVRCAGQPSGRVIKKVYDGAILWIPLTWSKSSGFLEGFTDP